MRKGTYLQHSFFSEDSMEPYPNLYLKAGAQAPTQSTNPLSIRPEHVFSSQAAHCCSVSGDTVVLARSLAHKQAGPLETRTNAKKSYQST